MRTIKIAAAACALVLSACGTDMMGSSGAASQLASYRTLGLQMTATVDAYAADTATLPDVPACEAAHTRYEGAMPGMVDRMRAMSDAMDRHMADMGHSGFDMTCMADAMRAELQRHHAAACTGPGVPADEQEAAAHVQAMRRFMEHQRMRYQDAGSSMGMMGPPDGSTFTCRRNADGSFTLNGQTWSPGMPVPGTGTCTGDACAWPVPCGGMMCGGDMGMH